MACSLEGPATRALAFHPVGGAVDPVEGAVEGRLRGQESRLGRALPVAVAQSGKGVRLRL